MTSQGGRDDGSDWENKSVPFYVTVSVPGGKSIGGILTHIDKTGKVLSDRVIRPQEPGVFGGSYLKGCFPWGDGFALIGDTYRVSGPPQPPDLTERFFWVLALDAAGNVKWEKLIPTTEELNSRAAYIAPNQNLVLPTSRISRDGEVKNTESDGSSSLDLIPQIIVGADGQWKITEGDNPKRQSFLISKVDPKIAYRLPNQAIVGFGSIRKNNAFYAAIGWLSPDGKQSESFEYGDTLWVDDAIPTGDLGEFAAVRLVSSVATHRLGMYLSFIQVK